MPSMIQAPYDSNDSSLGSELLVKVSWSWSAKMTGGLMIRTQLNGQEPSAGQSNNVVVTEYCDLAK